MAVGIPTTAMVVLAAIAIGVTVGLLPIGFGALAVAAFPLAVLIIRDPRVPLVLLAFSIPYSSLTKVGGETYAITSTEVLVAILLLVWIARRVVDRDVNIRVGPTIVLMAILLLCAILSTLVAEDFPNALKEVLKLGEMLGVAVYAASELNRPADMRLAIFALLLAGASEAIVGIVQFVIGYGPPSFAIGPFMRASGNFDQPNALAGYLGMLLPLGIAFSFHASRERRIIVIATMLIGLGVLATFSRGSWLGSILGLGLMALLWGAASRRALVGASGVAAVILTLAVAGVLPASLSDRVASVFENFGVFDITKVDVTPTNYALVQRMALWQAGWAMARDNPIVGIGPGNYESAYPRYFVESTWSEPLPHAHNYYLNTFAELGILGLVALLGFCVAVFARIGQGLRQTSDLHGIRRALLLGALAAMVTFSVHNAVDNMFVHGIGVQFALILGLVEAGFVASPRETPAMATGQRVAPAL
jgi:O-antigen ligase